MDTNEQSKISGSLVLMFGLWLIGLSGLVALIKVVASGSGGFREWIQPLAPWSLAICLFAWTRNKQRARKPN